MAGNANTGNVCGVDFGVFQRLGNGLSGRLPQILVGALDHALFWLGVGAFATGNGQRAKLVVVDDSLHRGLPGVDAEKIFARHNPSLPGQAP